MSAQSHRSDPRILGRRTLARDHRYLAGLLRPGSDVLDVGCGTGSITAGIAQAVGPLGQVIGMDRDLGLLELARQEHAAITNLRFEPGDATTLDQTARYDFVTAARTLQWIPEPGLAIQSMKRALKPGGLLIVLDYNHCNNAWEPEPPEEFKLFYRAFLAWRSSNGCSNQMAAQLPQLFESAGLIDVRSHVQDEVVERGNPDFGERTALWLEVIDNLGARLAAAGFCTNEEIERARATYAPWLMQTLQKQTLAMAAVVGVAP